VSGPDAGLVPGALGGTVRASSLALESVDGLALIVLTARAPARQSYAATGPEEHLQQVESIAQLGSWSWEVGDDAVHWSLPDDLAAAVREARLSVSPICQTALAEAVRVVGAAREAVEVMRDPEFDPREHPQISARVAARMTGHLRHALDHAREVAGAGGLVETEHLLVGVIDHPTTAGPRCSGRSTSTSVACEIQLSERARLAPGRAPPDVRGPVQAGCGTAGSAARTCWAGCR
jgi:hypothetical protein